MITALVQFTFPNAISHAQAKEAFLGSAPKYRKVEGLIRKYYLLAEDGKSGGGVYLWQKREDAERFFNQEWKDFIASRYGSQPSITWFASPVIVDNASGEITSGES